MRGGVEGADRARSSFSSLDVMAARLGRRGNAPAAERVVAAAADLEAGPEFAVLRSRLPELPARLAALDHAARCSRSSTLFER